MNFKRKLKRSHIDFSKYRCHKCGSKDVLFKESDDIYVCQNCGHSWIFKSNDNAYEKALVEDYNKYKTTYTDWRDEE